VNKNFTPGSISLIAAGSVGISIGVIYFLITNDLSESLVLFLGVFTISLTIFYVLVQRFIFSKLRILRKAIQYLNSDTISYLKILQNPNKDIIFQVSEQVFDFAKDSRYKIDELQKLAEYRKQFLGNVSHELKTPIFSAQGYIHTLLDGALEDSKVNRLFLERASKSMDRLVALVNDLTALSYLQGNEHPLNKTEVNLQDAIEETFEMCNSNEKNKKITLHIKKKSTPDPLVLADEDKIKQVFINLFENAIRYGKKNGVVSVGFYEIDDLMVIEVSDNGYGIEEEHLPRLFERFYRTDQARSRHQGGTGLGLSIVKHIIEQHGFKISVTSKINQGTTFSFMLERP
jgi:two-component system phosphate regulon sensor histidine kinase PhoR